MKKVFSLILVLLLVVSLPVNAEAATIVDSGTCGENLTWTLDDEGTLTISGTGKMGNYDYWGENIIPWYESLDSITSVVIENGVTSIGNRAFGYCSSLTSITIPESVTSIGESAFQYCSSLTSITIPEDVTSISGHTFYHCSSLTSITIPEGVTSIGVFAFENCTSLTSITIPEGVTSIDAFAFANCTSLTSITIPESVTSIGESAFENCTSLTSIRVAEGNPSYSSDDRGVLFNKSKTTLIKAPGGISGSYAIPDGVTSIGDSAFSYCSSLTSITIPEGVSCIDYAAFEYCTSLTSITIPEGITSISDYAFSECSSLTSITIPEGVTSIGTGAFNYCSSLTEIIFLGDAPSFGSWVFDRVIATAYYPAGNDTWTSDVMQNYDGTITWVAYSFSTYKPTVSVAKNSYNSLTVTWSEVPGAKYYEVYRSTNPDSSFVKLGIYDSKTLSKVSSSLATGTKYYYKVRAYKVVDGYKKYSAYSDVVSATPTLSAPTNVTVSKNTYNTLKVSWNKVTGATYYQVYRSVQGANEWKLLGVYDENTTSMTSRSLSTGTTYEYRVRCYRWANSERQFSGWSTIKSGTPTLSAPTTVTVSKNTYNTLKVSWSKVEGAAYYQVYRSVQGANEWKLLGVYDENTTSMTSRSLSTGTTYEYRVRCYRWANSERQFSSWSTIKSGTPTMTAPTGVKATTGSTTGTVTVSWSKTAGATYYQVYRSATGTGDWKLLGTYDENTTSMTSKALVSGTTYYYRVRCYRWAGGERQFSSFSTSVSAAAK